MKSATHLKTVAVPYFPGTNCEVETMEAIKQTGKAKPVLLFIDDILSGKHKPKDFDLIFWSGGWSHGDDPRTGAVAAVQSEEFILSAILAGVPMIGVCNGFQTLVEAGVFGKNITLTENDSGVFCSRPTEVIVQKSNCIWTKGMEDEILPCHAAHHGGKLIVETGVDVNVVTTYYSESPNGGNIAGISSHNGLIFGQMDHIDRPFDSPIGQQILLNGIAAV